MIRCKNWRGAKLVKDTTKKLFSGGMKKLVDAGTVELKSRGITLKSDISFVSAYL
jgi:hypothetical protein